jgi:hypothetical protein
VRERARGQERSPDIDSKEPIAVVVFERGDHVEHHERLCHAASLRHDFFGRARCVPLARA